MRETPLLPASRDSEVVSTLGYAAKCDLQRPKDRLGGTTARRG